MAKKTFSTSPLMTFITPAAPTAPEDSPAHKAEEQGSGRDVHGMDTPPEQETAPKAPETPAPADQSAAPIPQEHSARKPRKDNCRTTPEERAQIAERNARFRSAPPTPPEYFAKPDTEEARSRRVQLLVKPSIYKEIRGIAHWKRQSVNNLMEEILAEYLNEHDRRGVKK